MSLKAYDPKLVIVTAYNHVFSGFIDSEFINLEHEAKMFEMQVGSDGEVSRLVTRNRSGKLVLTLQQNSLSNDFLSAQLALDLATGSNVSPLTIQQLNGDTLVFVPNCWIEGWPKLAFAKEFSPREWTLALDVIDPNIAGL